MNFVLHEHQGNSEINRSCVDSVKSAINGLVLTKRARTTQRVRTSILEALHRDGWSDEIKLDPTSSITVTSVRNAVGLCLQTGNVSRTYADLLKLQLLFSRKKIGGGIIILYSRVSARALGENLASFDRLKRELSIFKEVITVPVLLVGLEVVES